jgi:hypothetical protein
MPERVQQQPAADDHHDDAVGAAADVARLP